MLTTLPSLGFMQKKNNGVFMEGEYNLLREHLNDCLNHWEQEINNEDVAEFYSLLKENLRYVQTFKLYKYY